MEGLSFMQHSKRRKITQDGWGTRLPKLVETNLAGFVFDSSDDQITSILSQILIKQ
jgi:hypothetical protein